MSLAAFFASLNSALSGMTGLARAYDDPPEAISDFPSTVTYIGSGQLNLVRPGESRDQHTVNIDLLLDRRILPEAADSAKVWPSRVMSALTADETFGGNVDHIIWPVAYDTGPMVYGAELYFGIRFAVTVKMQGAIA